MATSNFKVYQSFDSADIISGKFNTVSSGFFPGGNVFFSQSLLLTSSAQVATASLFGGSYDILNGLYYTEVYDNSYSNPQVLFTIAYGNITGSGASNSDINQTQAIYTQYKNILLGNSDVDGMFSFRTGGTGSFQTVNSGDIYTINFSSMLTSNQIDPGQWNITLKGPTGTISLIDETPLKQVSNNSGVYEIISGSYDSSLGQTVQYGTGSYNGYGLFYPANGIIVLNASQLSSSIGLAVPPAGQSGSLADQYQIQIYNALVNASGSSIRIRKSEFVPSTHYFVRVKNQDYNFTNNPTFVYNAKNVPTGNSPGDIIAGLSASPTTYVTTIGLYNDVNELVAVAKLSRPTHKDFNSEILCRIRLDF